MSDYTVLHVSDKETSAMLCHTSYVLQACSEGSLFRACMTWAEGVGRNFDEVEQLLPLIRFPLMTQQELQVITLHSKQSLSLRKTALMVQRLPCSLLLGSDILLTNIMCSQQTLTVVIGT